MTAAAAPTTVHAAHKPLRGAADVGTRAIEVELWHSRPASSGTRKWPRLTWMPRPPVASPAGGARSVHCQQTRANQPPQQRHAQRHERFEPRGTGGCNGRTRGSIHSVARSASVIPKFVTAVIGRRIRCVADFDCLVRIRRRTRNDVHTFTLPERDQDPQADVSRESAERLRATSPSCPQSCRGETTARSRFPQRRRR